MCIFLSMRTHEQIDRRSLKLARAVVSRIDADPSRDGLRQARALCRTWLTTRPSPALEEWDRILSQPWEQVRSVLLDTGERGTRLRQSTPFCGILTPRERWDIYREFERHEASRA